MNIPVRLTIREESFHLYWSTLLVVCVLLIALVLQQLSFSYSWWYTISMIAALGLLLATGIHSIRQITHPQLSAVLRIDQGQLEITRYIGKDIAGVEVFGVLELEQLDVRNYHRDEKDLALFDFSPNYVPLIRIKGDNQARPLIRYENELLTLRLEDIRDIADFFADHLSSATLGARLRQILSMM